MIYLREPVREIRIQREPAGVVTKAAATNGRITGRAIRLCHKLGV